MNWKAAFSLCAVLGVATTGSITTGHAKTASKSVAASSATLVVPGESVGRVKLGMTRAQVRKQLGVPSRTVRWKSGETQDTWLGASKKSDGTKIEEFERRFLNVISRRDRAIQIEFNSPTFRTRDGISINSTLAQFRARYPRPRAQSLLYADPEGGGYIGYYYDSVRRGLAFQFGAQDSFDSRVKPDSLRVHAAGRRVLPDPGGQKSETSPAQDELPLGKMP